MQTLKAGTRAQTFGTKSFAGFPGVAPEAITICKPRKGEGTPRGIDGKPLDGWHLIKFADGGRLCMHETGFRVIDNR